MTHHTFGKHYHIITKYIIITNTLSQIRLIYIYIHIYIKNISVQNSINSPYLSFFFDAWIFFVYWPENKSSYGFNSNMEMYRSWCIRVVFWSNLSKTSKKRKRWWDSEIKRERERDTYTHSNIRRLPSKISLWILDLSSSSSLAVSKEQEIAPAIGLYVRTIVFTGRFSQNLSAFFSVAYLWKKRVAKC